MNQGSSNIFIPEEGSHWYYPDGSPCYTVANASKPGEERPTTVRDAKQMGLLPSVTVINRMVAKPALTAYLISEHVLSAVTLPKFEGEPLDAFVSRVVIDARQHGEKAAGFGTRMHSFIEYKLSGGQIPPPALNISDVEVLEGVDDWLGAHPIEVKMLETSLASAELGFGGRLDAVGTVYGLEDYPGGLECLIDWKSQESRPRRKGQFGFNHYPENAMQGAAYSMLLGRPELPHLCLYIDSKIPGHIEPVVYTIENSPWRWGAFLSAKFLYYSIGPGSGLGGGDSDVFY